MGSRRAACRGMPSCLALIGIRVVIEIDVRRFAPLAIPAKDQPPLLVDADRMQPRQIAAKLLEVITGRYAQVDQSQIRGINIQRELPRGDFKHGRYTRETTA